MAPECLIGTFSQEPCLPQPVHCATLSAARPLCPLLPFPEAVRTGAAGLEGGVDRALLTSV